MNKISENRNQFYRNMFHTTYVKQTTTNFIINKKNALCHYHLKYLKMYLTTSSTVVRRESNRLRCKRIRV